MNDFKKRKQTTQTLEVFLSGTVDVNPPADTGDTGSIPGLGESHVSEQLSLCAATTEPAF